MRATARLISTDATTVRPKFLKNWPDTPGISADRQEHRDDREGGRDHRQTDFVGRVDRGLIGALAHAHVAHDVLDLDDRIVDQHAGDQAQRQQRHAG